MTDERFELPPNWRSWPIEKKRQLRRELADDRAWQRGDPPPVRDGEARPLTEDDLAQVEALLAQLPPPSAS